ncbi:MAG: LytTR family DNA-binding domain-containing protein [Candidatus Limiplasma sp.]|nr:LytTR family DNA-binding domain-containing protein [Candidatus Limiplasma sp.]
MRIAICDDEVVYRIAISEAVNHWQKTHSIDSILVHHYHSSEDLLNDIENNQRFDILFLDIQIPNEMSGIELAKRVRKSDECVQIVFFTNYSEYAYEGYYVNALRYLRKPVHPDQVSECLDIAFTQWKYSQDESIILEDSQGKNVLRYKSILYIESNGHTLVIHCTHEKRTVTIRQRLVRLYDELPHAIFSLCNRSFIVNIMYIRKITYDRVIMANGVDIAMGKQYRDGIRASFSKYYQGLQL